MWLDDFDRKVDGRQRAVVERALARRGAPFDPARADFGERVDGLWRSYRDDWEQESLGDRLLYSRLREEYIDRQDLPDARRQELIGSLDRLNRGLMFYTWLERALRLHIEDAPKDELTLLDLGSGHGMVPIRLAERSQSGGRLGGKRLRVTGSDIAPAYVAAAQQNARARGVDVEFRCIDALHLAELGERFDVITCTQTVHHFPPALVARFLDQARRTARHGVLFFDARRTWLNTVGVSVAAAAISLGDPLFVHDAVVSVRRMYSPAELELLARAAPGGELSQAHNFGPFYVVLESTGQA